ncbi:MAG: ABC-F family ATP-binding cassette domain-containing protein [Deltaproteobacteria bacterium]|nr:ABC-F family ATP-binding cassette domain-containing protein [Deltaproteobacteria bacterium]
MPVIDCTAIEKIYGHRTILSDVTLTIRTGERVGLVGDNGCGKSTLGRILAGALPVDGGTIARRRGARIEYLSQEPELPVGLTASQVVLASLDEWGAAKQRYDDITSELGETRHHDEEGMLRRVADQAHAAGEVERLGGWERLHEAETIVGHLGIEDPNRAVDTMSGGERRRVALAQILVDAPDLAILDEPTNHLDIATIEWLEEYFARSFGGALLLITHDRYVLDHITTRTLELHDGTLDNYNGGYSTYLEARAEREAHEERTERNRQNFLRRELEWLRRQPKARGTKQKARTGRAQAAIDQTGPKRPRTTDLRLHAERLGKTILSLSGLRIERDDKILVDSLDLDLAQGERIGVVGANGTGKTSLLLTLLGDLEPTQGDCTLGANTRIGYLDQDRVGLDDDATIREAVAGDQSHVEIANESLTIGSYLERFLFSHKDQHMKVGVLSGGERARVCIARLLCQKTNLILLDEPTNDLDVSTLGALESMLTEYGGSALIVSHDRWFLDRVATSILAFEGEGRVDLHRGHYSDYRERKLAEQRAENAVRSGTKAAARTESAVSGSGPSNSSQVDESGGRSRKLSFKEERELAGLIERIEAKEAVVAGLENRLADPATYEGGGGAAAELSQAFEAASDEVASLTARWEELEARKAAWE